ncbi:MAG: hypothetical protein ACE5DI_00540 [Candidatus Micrarchaeia archaeon]
MKKQALNQAKDFRLFFEDELSTVKKQFQSLEKTQRQAIQQNAKQLNQRFAQLSLLLKKPKTFSKADEMLFSFEELPTFGKEYWFLNFASTDKNSMQQLVLTIGRSSGEVKVNKKPVVETGAANQKDCMNVGWHYAKKKTVFANKVQKTTAKMSKSKPCSLSSNSKDFAFALTGAYPSYEIRCKKKGKTVFQAKMKKPANEPLPVEFASFFKGAFGFQLVNLYFNFQGKLDGKPFKGKCYLQKVVAVGPLVPWRWARIVFQNNSVMEFFKMTTPTPEFMPKGALISWYSFQPPGEKRQMHAGKIQIQKTPTKGKTRWIAKSSDGKAFLEASNYSKHNFAFESKTTGRFVYEEHFAKINDFYYKGKNKTHTLKTTGSGQSLFEDAYGFLL